MKTNCWEIKKCGREAGGKNASILGICPASTEARLHGVHGGQNAGRACWIVKATLCGGEQQGGYGEKFKNCQRCEVFAKIHDEEGMNYINSALLLPKVKTG